MYFYGLRGRRLVKTNKLVQSIPCTISDHIGHDVEVITYANKIYGNASIECLDCSEVLAWEQEEVNE